MANKFHVNPDTQKIGVCRARTRPCKFGAEHPHFQDEQTAFDYLIASNPELRAAYEERFDGMKKIRDEEEEISKNKRSLEFAEKESKWTKDGVLDRLMFAGGGLTATSSTTPLLMAGMLNPPVAVGIMAGVALAIPAGFFAPEISKLYHKTRLKMRRKNIQEAEAQNARIADRLEKFKAQVLEKPERDTLDGGELKAKVSQIRYTQAQVDRKARDIKWNKRPEFIEHFFRSWKESRYNFQKSSTPEKDLQESEASLARAVAAMKPESFVSRA